MKLASMLKRFGVAALIGLGAVAVGHTADLVFSTGSYFQSGFRLVDGNDLNVMVRQVNTLTSQTAGTTAGAYTGTFNGTVGATTPSTIAATSASISGHVNTGATPPVLTSCGGGTPTITGSDTAGEVTMGTSATACTITFAAAYASAPYCVVTSQTNTVAIGYTISASAITLAQTSTSGNKADYLCIARSGG